MSGEERRRDTQEVLTLRETDRWLRRVAVYIPILAFVMGWGSGVITTFLVFKDHERRLSIIEKGQADQDLIIRSLIEKIGKISGMIERHLDSE